MENILTVDLEDWYCISSLERVIPRERWFQLESRVHIGATVLLEQFRRHDVRATFFVLGCVAERAPWLVERIAAAGHEIASHGYFHERVDRMSPDQFAVDIERSCAVIERMTGELPLGYRAPNFSLTQENSEWVTRRLRSAGFQYDASLFSASFPVDRGFQLNVAIPFSYPNGLTEVPIGCLHAGPLRIPVTGGAYFRHAPYRLTSALIRRCNRLGRRAVMYFHPWEFDEGFPQTNLSTIGRVRHTRGIPSMTERLTRLLGEHRFTSITRALALDASHVDR